MATWVRFLVEPIAMLAHYPNWPRILSKELAALYVSGAQRLRLLEERYQLRALQTGQNKTCYSRTEIDDAVARMEANPR